jgi:nitroreductase
METWDAITARRNVRQYKPEPISDDDLKRIAEAGWRAPSAKNRQAWDFVIVTDRTQLEELSTVWQGAGHIAKAAAAIAFVIPEPPDERRKVTDQYDVGQATMAMMIAATDLGIGTGHSSVGDQDKARAILGVPDGYQVAYMLGIGYPADRPLKPIRKPNRRPFDEVVEVTTLEFIGDQHARVVGDGLENVAHGFLHPWWLFAHAVITFPSFTDVGATFRGKLSQRVRQPSRVRWEPSQVPCF